VTSFRRVVILPADQPLTEALLKAGTAAVAYETITDNQGGLPCLAPMSEIAGRMAALEGQLIRAGALKQQKLSPIRNLFL